MKIGRPPREGLVRALPRLEFRAANTDPDGDGDNGAMPTLTGHFAVFNQATEIKSYYEGNFIERIAPGAFKKTFAEQRDTMRVLFQHGMDFQVGDKPLGPIQELREDEEGAFYEVPLLDTSYNRDLIPGLEAELYGASFRFRVIREEWDEEPDATDDNPNGLPERLLREVEVPEFGPVTFPAYEGASAGFEASSSGMRSLTDEYLVRRVARDPDRLADMLASAVDAEQLSEMLSSRTANRPVIRSAEKLAAEVAEPAAADSEQQTTEPEETPSEQPEVPATTSDVAPQDTAPPEGAGRDGHPQAGRRDNNTQEATPAAAITSLEEKRMTLQELEARQAEIALRFQEINEEHREAELPAEIQSEYDTLETERSANETKITGIRARIEKVRSLAQEPGNREAGAAFHTPSPARSTDPYDINEVRSVANAAASEGGRSRAFMDAALRAVEGERVFYHDRADEARSKAHVEQLLRREGSAEGARSEIAERIIGTGGQLYQRSFVKALAGAPLSSEEQRALATFTGAGGGFAVPYQLDPTVIPTSNHSVNPYRAISRVVQTIGNEWKGVTSTGVTAAYHEEGAEAADGTPTIGQPTANPERCDVFVPFSVEIEQDWGSVLQELALMISDAKDDIEAEKYTLGAGHASKEPEGIITGATELVAAGGVASFAVADLYKTEEALPARFRPRAAWVANRFAYNKTRQFDTAGGAALWTYLGEGLSNMPPTPGNIGRPLLGYPAYEASAMDAALTTGKKIMVIGDFERYFLIVDRIGMNVEIVQHLVGANRRPTGQRGLFAYWRNTSKVLSPKAFRVLQTS